MAFWHKKQAEFTETDDVIHTNPGLTQAELARNLDVSRSTVARRLPSMEEAGYLYSRRVDVFCRSVEKSKNLICRFLR